MTNADNDRGRVPYSSFGIAGVRIDAVDFDPAVELLLDPNSAYSVHLCNAYTVSLASRDDRYASTLNSGTLNLADGMPVVWVAKRRKVGGLTARVCGPDLMRACIERGVARGTRHYLYGSTEEVLSSLVSEIQRIAPGALIVGAESPPFRELDDAERRDVIARIEATEADLVWVGLGTPKQDYEVERLANAGVTTFVAIGAAFDFIAGNKKRAPLWMQKRGLEWVFRFISEPRRLWKRYLVGNARFAWLVVRGAQ